jgi:hypothetical protein
MNREVWDRPLIRWGLPGVLLLVALHAATLLSDLASSARREAADAAAAARAFAALSAAPRDAAVDDGADRLWRAASEGQARALVQSRAQAALAAAGIVGVEIRVEPAVTLAPGLWRLTAVLSGPFQPALVEPWLVAPLGADAPVRVERLRMQAAPAPRFEATLAAPIVQARP